MLGRLGITQPGDRIGSLDSYTLNLFRVATPVAGSQPADAAGSRLPRLERGHVCLTNSEVDDRWAGPRSDDAKLTVPLTALDDRDGVARPPAGWAAARQEAPSP